MATKGTVSKSGRKARQPKLRNVKCRATKTLPTQGQKPKQRRSGDAKTPKPEFYEVLEAFLAEREQEISDWRKRLPRFVPESDERKECVTKIETCQRRLKLFEERRQRYERYQTDDRIPAELRKEIAKAETEVLRSEVNDEGEGVLDMRCELHALLTQADRMANPLKTRNAAFEVGKWYSRTRIEKAYDDDVCEVLRDQFDTMTVPPGKDVIGHKILAALPKKSEYLELKERFYTTTLADLQEDAYLNLYEVRGEVQEEQANLDDDSDDDDDDERCSQEDHNDYIFRVEERIQRMLNEEPVLPTCVSSLPIVFYRMSSMFRDARVEAVAMMRAVVQAIEKYRNSGVDVTDADAKVLDACCRSLNHDANEVEYVCVGC